MIYIDSGLLLHHPLAFFQASFAANFNFILKQRPVDKPDDKKSK